MVIPRVDIAPHVVETPSSVTIISYNLLTEYQLQIQHGAVAKFSPHRVQDPVRQQ